MEKYLNKFYDFIDRIGKHNFILITFIIIVLIITGLYQTFSLYTESEDVTLVDGVETYSFILNPDNTTNTVTIVAGNKKNLDITVYNKSDIDLLYGIYYTSSNVLDDVVIWSVDRTAYLPNGTISGNSSYVVTVKVNNFSDSDVTINFGMKYGFENGGGLTLDDGENWIMPLNSINTLFTSTTDYSYFKDDTYREKIVNASFVKNVDTSNATSDTNGNPIVWDISVGGDGRVLAWLEENETTSSNYDLYIGSNEIIFAKDLSFFFTDMINLQNISFDNLNTSMTTTMHHMFSSSGANDGIYMNLTSLDLNSFDTSNVTNMAAMFYGCGNLTTLDLSNFDTSKVTTMKSMFAGCYGLTSLDLSNFDTSKVTTMRLMFSGCTGLTSLDVSNFDTSNVDNMGYMFNDCSSLTTLDVSNFDTSNVNNMSAMFYRCINLTTLNLSNFDTSNVLNMSNLFYNCSSLTSLDVSNFDTSSVIYMQSMFIGCSGLTNLDVSNFDTSNVTDMSWMFCQTSGLISLDLSNFDTSKVTTMRSMFSGCTGLISLDVSNFNTSNVTTTELMFYECASLISLDLSSFNTTNVTIMSNMFYGCSSLTTLDLSSFDTSNVTAMGGMFCRCNNLSTTIIITNINETTYSAMFSSAATIGDAQIIVYCTNETSDLVDLMIATKSTDSNVIKQFYLSGTNTPIA